LKIHQLRKFTNEKNKKVKSGPSEEIFFVRIYEKVDENGIKGPAIRDNNDNEDAIKMFVVDEFTSFQLFPHCYGETPSTITSFKNVSFQLTWNVKRNNNVEKTVFSVTKMSYMITSWNCILKLLRFVNAEDGQNLFDLISFVPQSLFARKKWKIKIPKQDIYCLQAFNRHFPFVPSFERKMEV
jgi:hypothetical protein